MERAAQFRDGERVDSSTGTAERLDAVKRGHSRYRRAETTAARRCPSTGAFLSGRRASTAGFRTLQVKPQSREARLWLVIVRASLPPTSGISSRTVLLDLYSGNTQDTIHHRMCHRHRFPDDA